MPGTLTTTPSACCENISELVPLQSIVTDCEMVSAPNVKVASTQASVPPSDVTGSAAASVLHGAVRGHWLDVLASLPFDAIHVLALVTTANAGGADQKEADRAASVARN